MNASGNQNNYNKNYQTISPLNLSGNPKNIINQIPIIK
jgi:hypothetical protein